MKVKELINKLLILSKDKEEYEVRLDSIYNRSAMYGPDYFENLNEITIDEARKEVIFKDI